jgi:predicted metal-dependent hydrolase
MSKKSGAIAQLIQQFEGRQLDAHYLGYFECFNRQLYFEAHDVLEELWLSQRQGPNYSFYKGLIQFAGAFVHLKKNRLRPAAALFKLADANLQKYPASHEQLSVQGVRTMISHWLSQLESANFEVNPLIAGHEPKLQLEQEIAQRGIAPPDRNSTTEHDTVTPSPQGRGPG